MHSSSIAHPNNLCSRKEHSFQNLWIPDDTGTTDSHFEGPGLNFLLRFLSLAGPFPFLSLRSPFCPFYLLVALGIFSMTNGDLQPNWHNILIAYNVLTSLSIFLVALVLLPPLLSKRVHRRSPWYSHMLSWLVAAVTLLLMIGHQRDAQPPPGLCFVQSALLYATPPLTAFSMVCYLLDINLALSALLNKRTRKKKFGTSIILALFPWIVFLAIITEVSIVFSLARTSFHPSGNPNLHLFCHYNSRITNIISTILTSIAALILIVVKGWTIILLIRKFKSYEWSSRKISQMVLSAFIRTAIFTGVALVGTYIGVISCTIKNHDAVWSLVWPLLPSIAAIVYGIHEDVIQCVMFWKRTPDPVEEENSLPGGEEETMFVDIQAKCDTPRAVPDSGKPEASTQF